MIVKNLPINFLLVSRDRVVTAQWRNWLTLGMINLSSTLELLATVCLQIHYSYS